MIMTEEFTEAFERWLSDCATLVKESTTSKHREGYNLTTKQGSKYVKVIMETGDQRSVWAFVKKSNGDIFKPAHWKRPELNHARGNIFDDDNGMRWIRWTGPMYWDSIKQ